MFDQIFTFLPLGLAALISGYTIYLLLHPAHLRSTHEIDLPAGIPVHDIAAIERDILHLRRVVVLAHTVDRPTGALYDAVERNFRRGVKYLFLVSASQAEKAVQEYYALFEVLARIVINQDKTKQLTDLVEIQQLPFEWDDFPYIFYRLEFPSGQAKTLAFCGDKVHKGIAAHYGRVEPAYAHTIARAIQADAPKAVKSISLNREQFDVPANIVEFPNAHTPSNVKIQ